MVIVCAGNGAIGSLPDQTYPLATIDYGRAVQLASELSQLSITAIEQRARLAVGGVVVID
jgi:hypothetical protein